MDLIEIQSLLLEKKSHTKPFCRVVRVFSPGGLIKNSKQGVQTSNLVKAVIKQVLVRHSEYQLPITTKSKSCYFVLVLGKIRIVHFVFLKNTVL